MAKVFIEETTLSAIGDAIREKEGSTALVPVTDMADRIKKIKTESEPEPTVYYLNNLTNVCQGVTFPENTELTVKVKSTDNASLAFMETTNLRSITLVSEDTTSEVNLQSAFRESPQLEIVDLRKFNLKVNNIQFFLYKSNVKEVLGTIDVSKCTAFPATTFGSALEYIRFKDGSIYYDISFEHAKNFHCIAYVLDGLYDYDEYYAANHTVKFHYDSVLSLFELHDPMTREPLGTIDTLEWEYFCSKKPGWTFLY